MPSLGISAFQSLSGALGSLYSVGRRCRRLGERRLGRGAEGSCGGVWAWRTRTSSAAGKMGFKGMCLWKLNLTQIDLTNFIFHKLESLCVSEPSVISSPNYRVQLMSPSNHIHGHSHLFILLVSKTPPASSYSLISGKKKKVP